MGDGGEAVYRAVEQAQRRIRSSYACHISQKRFWVDPTFIVFRKHGSFYGMKGKSRWEKRPTARMESLLLNTDEEGIRLIPATDGTWWDLDSGE